MKDNGKILKCIFAGVAFIAITVSSIVFKCDVYRVLPLYVSLLVMFLQMRASRMSFLVGGCNAIYYAVVYFCLKLYGIALYSLLVGFPIQIITYFRWKKRAYAHAAVLKRLQTKTRILWICLCSTAWVALYFILGNFGSEHIILDNSAAVIGAAANLASLLYLIEYPYIQSITHTINMFLNIQLICEDPKQWPYLIYFIYALVCAIISAIYMQRLYNKQQSEEAS